MGGSRLCRNFQAGEMCSGNSKEQEGMGEGRGLDDLYRVCQVLYSQLVLLLMHAVDFSIIRIMNYCLAADYNI